MVPLLKALFLTVILGLSTAAAKAFSQSVQTNQSSRNNKNNNSDSKNKSVVRVAEVNHVSHLNDNRLRVIFNAQERDGNLRFPITTIDRSMVKIEFTNTASAPAEPQSLLLHGTGVGEFHRALYVGFSMHRNLYASGVTELKSQVGDIIKGLSSEYLTVAAVAQDSGRIIADVTPEKGDNINRITQQIQSLEPEGEGPALADTLCVAAERFNAWNLTKFNKGDQKVLIIYTSPGDSPSTERYRAENCWRSLIDQHVRVFVVAFGKQWGRNVLDLTSTALDSGGHYHRVNGPVEMYAATKNIIALLNNEYVVDVDAPDIALEDQPLELKVKISYHNEIFESSIYNMGFVIPSLSKVFIKTESKETANGPISPDITDSIDWGMLSTVVISFVFLIFAGWFGAKFFFRNRNTTLCQTCSVRVKPDHSDCPFRKAETVARLVVIGGKDAGLTIPVMKGETVIARFPKSGAKISGRDIAWFNHGAIRLDGQKALYTPSKPARDRINGWLVHEPRLLGVGNILTIGDQKLRFEVKPQIHT